MLYEFAMLAALTSPVFTRDIAPIFWQHCVSCHRAGEVAPFALDSYPAARQRARLIAEATTTRLMPPWKPLPGYGHFADARVLSRREIDLISRWAAAGAPQGNPAALPPLPPRREGWQLGEPDLVVQAPSPVIIPADGPDLYQCFVVPMNLPRERYIRAVEFRPSNRRVVHHALLFADISHIALEPRYSCFGTIGLLPSLSIGGWSPGYEAIRTLEGAALPLKAGSRLIVQVHYHPDGKPEEDQWSAGFYFTDQPPVRRVVDVGLASKAIDIPAGDSHYVVREHFTTPIDIDVVGVIPHAHLVCREMRAWAMLPNGTKRWLLNIRDWDFNWQDQYRYVTPIRLPADTTIEMEFVYDNSAANPRNPNSPPKRVVWGAGVSDEMAGLHLQAIPVHMNDMPLLGQALWGAVMRSVGGRFYTPPQ